MNDNTQKETSQSVSNTSAGRHRLAIVAAGIGVGAVLAYFLREAFGGRKQQPVQRRLPDQIVDDRGTGQEKAARILRNLRDRAFESSDEKLALALGRPIEEVTAWNAGLELIDDDVVMKARGIAMHRGVHIE